MIPFSKDELLISILLVENIPHMAKVIREMLLSMGFRNIHRVTNVIHGCQFVISQRPHLVIGEVNLSPVGCARLCKALRIAADSPNRTLPILLTLTEATAGAASQVRDAGATYRHAAHAVLDIDAEVLAGTVPPPPELVMEDNERLLRPMPRVQGAGRKILVTQLEEGMELAEPVRSGDGVVVPRGVVLRNDVIAGLCRLLENGRIAPLIRVV